MEWATSYLDISGSDSMFPFEWMMVTLFVSTENPLSFAVMSFATIKSRLLDLIFILLFMSII